jgi:hypothetical protein
VSVSRDYDLFRTFGLERALRFDTSTQGTLKLSETIGGADVLIKNESPLLHARSRRELETETRLDHHCRGSRESPSSPGAPKAARSCQTYMLRWGICWEGAVKAAVRYVRCLAPELRFRFSHAEGNNLGIKGDSDVEPEPWSPPATMKLRNGSGQPARRRPCHTMPIRTLNSTETG